VIIGGFLFPDGLQSGGPIFLAGSTAVGKSVVALELAERVSGEIISVDSMQVYRGMDIGTAKPTAAERSRVPHHLIDIADISQPFDAAQFVRLARQAVSEIQSRGHTPIFCGGTGLYFKAYLQGLGSAPPSNAELRTQLAATPLPELLQELEQTDPVTFQNIDRQNPRRVVRALEVLRLTGRPYSAQRADWTATATPTNAAPCFGLFRQPGELRERIHARVDAMFKAGWVAETEFLLSQGLDQNSNAMQALGYRQIVEHLRGARSLPETIELIKIRTRQFAKRQLTWFRRQMRLEWLTFSPPQR
jgi:tRNA dimethylallyltransferase